MNKHGEDKNINQSSNFTDLQIELLKNVDFQKVCDYLNDGIYVSDSNGRTLYVNETYCKNLGVEKHEIIGKNVADLEGKLYVGSVTMQVVKNKKRIDSKGRLLLNDIPVLITGIPVFDKNGDVEMVVISNRNLTQLNALEDNLDKLQKILEIKHENSKYLIQQNINEKQIIYASPSMNYLMTALNKIAKTDATILITGETGTGKELVANAVYSQSLRSEQAFIKVNCASIPETLLESELFGYEPGSFTNALKKGKIGLFELANKGTLLLDEIGEIPLAMQSKLLRALQEKEIRRIGGHENIPVDIRLIVATNLDLKAEVQKGNFREDLYYRLNVIPINIPPLRERKEDIRPLADHFFKLYNKKHNKNLAPNEDFLKFLYEYNWPGNIRELENIIERIVVTETDDFINPDVLNQIFNLQKNNSSSHFFQTEEKDIRYEDALKSFEVNLFTKSLSNHTSLRKTASTLGISPGTLSLKCKEYNINIYDYLKR